MLFIGKKYVERLVARFSLSTTINRLGQFILSPIVVPVTQTDELLATYAITNITVDCSAADVAIDTVPVGKRRRYILIEKGITVNATNVYALKPGGLSIDLFSPATANTIVNLRDLIFDAGDILKLTTGNALDTAILMRFMYREEDAY